MSSSGSGSPPPLDSDSNESGSRAASEPAPDLPGGPGGDKKESNPSSEVSIEELGAEAELDAVEKKEDAEEILPKEVKEVKEEKQEEKKVEEITTEGAEDLGRILREEADADRRQFGGGSDDEDDDEDDDDFEDETVLERLLALSEMFPESVRNGTCSLASGSVSGTKWLYEKSRNMSWIVFSSAAILFLPIMIESERLGIEEMQKQQQRQILLGPGAAMSGAPGAAGGPPMQ